MAKDYAVNVTINGKDNASHMLKNFSETATVWLKRAEVAAIAAAVTFSTMSVKWGMDFEAQMSAVKAVSQATVSEMAALTAKAKQLGRDTAFAATEAAQGMEILAQAGLSVANNIAAIGPVLDLAAAGSISVAEAADIATGAMAAFKLQASGLSHVADVLALGASATNTSVGELGQAFKYAAPVASALGYSIEQTVAALSLMSNSLIKGEMAGTTFRGLLRLLKPTDEMLKAMDALNMNIKDATGSMLPLDQIISQINPKMLKNVDYMGKLTTIFGLESISGFVALIGEGADKMGGFTNELIKANGVAKEMADTRLDNLSGAFRLIKSSIQMVSIALMTGSGDGSLSNNMKTFIKDSLIPMVNGIAGWAEQMGGIAGIFQFIIQMVTMFVNDVKTAFYNLFTNWDIFKQFAVTFGAALDQAFYAVIQFGLRMTAALGGFIEIVAETIGLILLSPISVLFSQLKEVFVMFLNWLGPKVIEITNMILTPFRWALKKMGVEIGTVDWTPITEEPALQMKDIWPAVWQEFGYRSKLVLDYAVKAAKDFGYEFSIAGKLGKKALSALNPELVDLEKYVKMYEDFKRSHGVGASTPEAPTVTQDIYKVGEYAESLNAAALKFPFMWQESLRNTMTWTKQHAKLGDVIHYNLKQGWKAYLDELPAFGQMVEDYAKHLRYTIDREVAQSIFDFLREGSFTFKHGWKMIVEVSKESIKQIFEKKVIDKAIEELVGFVTDTFTGKNDKKKGFAGIRDSFEHMWDGLESVIDTVWAAIKWAANWIKEKFFGSNDSAFEQIVAAAVGPGGMWYGIATPQNGVYDKFTAVLEAYRTAAFEWKFGQIVDLARTGVNSMWYRIATPENGVYTQFTNMLEAYKNSAFNWKFGQIVDLARTGVNSMWYRIATPENGVYTQFTNMLEAYRTAAFEWKFGQIVDLARTGVNSMWYRIATPENGVYNRFTEMLDAYKNDAFTWKFKEIIGLATGPGGMWYKIADPPDGTLKDVNELLNKKGGLVDLFDAAFRSIEATGTTFYNNLTGLFNKGFTINYSYSQQGNGPDMGGNTLVIPDVDISSNKTDLWSRLGTAIIAEADYKAINALLSGAVTTGKNYPTDQAYLGLLLSAAKNQVTEGVLTEQAANDFHDAIKMVGGGKFIWDFGLDNFASFVTKNAHFPVYSDALFMEMFAKWKESDKTLNWVIQQYQKGGALSPFHSGGIIPGEGLFLGLSGEGVLNRSAMGRLGESGLRSLNEGRAPMQPLQIIIQAWDGKDVERVVREKVVPIFKSISEAGVTVVHGNGIKYATS